MPIYYIPFNTPTVIAQNVVFALPARACRVMASAAIEIGQTDAGPFAALAGYATGAEVAAGFIRCPGGSATITCKPLS
jgi:hypothetical protein